MTIHKIYKLIFCILMCSILHISCSSTAPLPATLNIVSPSPDVPPEIAAFSGVWEGMWDRNAADMILVIEKIDTQKAAIIYSVSGYRNYMESRNFITAYIKSGPSIEFIAVNGDKYTFTIGKELDEIRGVLIEGKHGTKNTVILHKRNTPFKNTVILHQPYTPVIPENTLCYDYTARKEYAKAIDECTKKINSDNVNASHYGNRCIAYLALEQLDKSIADCNKAIELEPKNANSFYNLAITYAKKEQYDQAIANLDKAIKVNPKYDLAYSYRGSLLLFMGKVSRAESDISKAIELNPDNVLANVSMAQFNSLINKNDIACKWLTKAIEKGYSDWNYIQTHSHFYNLRNAECYKAVTIGE